VLGEIGMGYYIREGLEGYCSCDTRIGTMVKDVCANVGVRYSFGKCRNKKESKKVTPDANIKVSNHEPQTETIAGKNISKTPKTGATIDKNMSESTKAEVMRDKNMSKSPSGIRIDKNVDEVSEVVKNEGIRELKINTVLFEFDKADIKPEAEKEIRDLAMKIGNEYKYEKIRIEGHTDSYGSDEYNRKLSLARAHAVHDVFAKYGIDVAKMEKIGYGESKPIDSNAHKKGRASNRRVEIFVDLY
jgi:outer membrane protein OmpA-like peptidoglycan-associated protein